ncbi:MAG: hypothetical protein AB1758_28275, partial [Candidatus Eremiobacterota bacterium]
MRSTLVVLLLLLLLPAAAQVPDERVRQAVRAALQGDTARAEGLLGEGSDPQTRMALGLICQLQLRFD